MKEENKDETGTTLSWHIHKLRETGTNFDITWDLLEKRIAGYLQPNQQAVSSLPTREIPHHVHTRGRHPQQEEGDLHPLHAQGQADLGQEEEESETIVLVLVNFHFLHFHFLQCFVRAGV